MKDHDKGDGLKKQVIRRVWSQVVVVVLADGGSKATANFAPSSRGPSGHPMRDPVFPHPAMLVLGRDAPGEGAAGGLLSHPRNCSPM